MFFPASFLATGISISYISIDSNFPRENFEKHKIIIHQMHQNSGMANVN